MDFTTDPQNPTFKHYNVLLISDNPQEVANIRHALAKALDTNFDVTHVDRLSAALRLLERDHFDIVLADLFVPDGSGVDIITNIHTQAPKVPIVAMARIGTERIAIEALRAGADDYFKIDSETAGDNNLLVRVVRHAIERRQLTNRLNFLREASDTLFASLDLDATVQTIGELAVPRMADCCILEFLDGSGKPTRAAMCSLGLRSNFAYKGNGYNLSSFTDDGAEQHLTWSPLVSQVLSRGRAELIEEIDEQALRVLAYTPAHQEKLQTLGITSMIITPLMSGGSQLGSLSLVALDERKSYKADDLALADELSRRCAVALDNALLYEKVERALVSQEELLARVSHDLRTPLTSVRAGLGLLSMNVAGKLSEKETALLNNAKRGAERLGILVNDLLTENEISRNTPLESEPLDLRTLVEEAVTLLQPLVAVKDQELDLDVPGPLPYNGNGKLLVQVLTNLLDNAHMHTPPGTRITVSSRFTPNEVMLMISDDGPGIPPELHEAIFERFYKAPSARRGRGLGLGLAIARSVVQMHGGRLSVESTPGDGTTFIISLPQTGDGETGSVQTEMANEGDC